METSLSRASLSTQTVRAWLISKFAAALEVEPERIQADEPIVSYGLDSMVTVEIAGELERALEMRLPPTLVWDYPTIEAIAEHLATLR
ncbi:acyl carrier protein [Pendulispora albinea]|uniref:Acyl carrier protein n=1 Tax=Pendulispora albinea TaxID=2741071 RepID=A0ABZ2MAI4_9BACT